MGGTKRASTDINFFFFHDGVSIRYGIWTCNEEPKGSIVDLNGRSEFLEKYAEPIQKLNQSGFDVYSFDWRGQGLSTRLLPDRHKGHVNDFQDYISDLKAMLVKIVKPRAVKPLMMIAHSMGGHIATRFIHDYPGMIEGAVLTAPMIDTNTHPLPGWSIRLLTRIMLNAGKAHSYAIGSGDYIPGNQKFNGNRLTSDPLRYMDHINAVIENPDLALGGVTYGWLSAAFNSIKIIHSPGYAESIETPVLIVSAGSDQIVSIKAQQNICLKMPNCKFILIKGARHEILKESDTVQSKFWNAFDRFTGMLLH